MRISILVIALFGLFSPTTSSGEIILQHHQMQAHHNNLEWIFPQHPDTHIHWGPDLHISHPAVMFNTSHWSHQFLSHLWLQGLNSYSHFGHVPETPIWHYLEWREEINPPRFDYYHPYFAGLFTPPHCVGLLPESPFYDNLEHRYDLNPVRFDNNHPYLADIMARNEYTENHCPVTAVPEPGSLYLVLLAIGMILIVRMNAEKVGKVEKQ